MLTYIGTGVIAGLLTLLPAWQVAAQAQPEPLAVELNRVASAGEACRLDFVVTNRSATRFDKLQADLVLFDKEGVIATRLTVDLGPMQAEKTQVKSFPIGSVDCANLGRVLLNEMVECTPPPGESFDCTRAVSISHRGPVPFVR